MPNKNKLLITYITAGDPSLAVTEKLVYDLEKAGADIIELGIPFSDSVADGPVIQASHQRAIKNNTSLADVFKLVSKIRKKTQVPIYFMLSYNLILQYGEDKFDADRKKIGVTGSIVPDLPAGESNKPHVYLVAPNTSEQRIKLIAERSSGFIYLMSITGITGKKAKLGEGLKEVVDRIRKYSKLPIAIGFGISNPAQAKQMAQYGDAIIVGSALVDLIAKKKIKQAIKLTASLKKAINAN